MKTRFLGHPDEVGADNRKRAQAWDKLYADSMVRLQKRIAEHKIPIPDIHPIQDLVLVYRLPNEYKGTIIIPDVAKFGDGTESPVESPYSIGVLLLAGAEATSKLETHGVLPGDYIQFAKYAGESETADRMKAAIERWGNEGMPVEYIERKAKELRDDEMTKKKLMRFQAPLVHQSIDLFGRLYGEKPTMQMVREVNAKGAVLHVIDPVPENIL
jgi:co-chaperonin GroES (HSP10)